MMKRWQRGAWLLVAFSVSACGGPIEAEEPELWGAEPAAEGLNLSAAANFPPGSPAAILDAQIRQRMDELVRTAPGKHQLALNQLSQNITAQNQLLQLMPPDVRPRVSTHFAQDNETQRQRLQELSGSVSRVFSPGESNQLIGASAQRLRDSITRTFSSYSQNIQVLPSPQREQLASVLSSEYTRVLQQVQPYQTQMAAAGASHQTVMAGQVALDSILRQLYTNLGQLVLQQLPVNKVSVAQAEFMLLTEARSHALYNYVSITLQPTSPTDVSKLPNAPAMQGPLNPSQANQTLGRLEQLIQTQYQARVNLANTLPPERRALAVYDAQTQRDRMLVSAFQNVLGRLTNPTLTARTPEQPTASTH